MRSLLKCISVVAAMLGATSTLAAPITFTDSTLFSTAISTMDSSTLDFDALSSGTLIGDTDVVDGIQFNYDFGGVQLMVTDVFDTTSAPNFLGTDDGDVLQDGDNFDLGFQAAVNAVGMYFLTVDELFDGDISLIVNGVTASLVAANLQTTLADGTDVYFLGIVDTSQSFSTASIETIGGGFFLYNVDDITTASASVPTPPIGFLWMIGIAALLRARNNPRISARFAVMFMAIGAFSIVAPGNDAYARTSLSDLETRVVDIEASHRSDPTHLKISKVTLEANLQEIYVFGNNLDNGTNLVVTFNGDALQVSQSTNAFIAAYLPANVEAGSYALEVRTGDEIGQIDHFNVVVGAVGPQGPQGPQGPSSTQNFTVSGPYSTGNGSRIKMTPTANSFCWYVYLRDGNAMISPDQGYWYIQGSTSYPAAAYCLSW